MGRFSVDLVAEGAIRTPVDVSVKKGRWLSLSISMVN